MYYLTGLAIAVLGYAPDAIESELVDAALDLKKYSFELEEDPDRDRFPNGWHRRQGVGFPEYVKAEIEKIPSPSGVRCLAIEANGGPVAIYSPLIPIDDRHSFTFRGYMKTEGLAHNGILFTVSFLNHKRERIKRFVTPSLSGTKDWTEFVLGPLEPDPDTTFLVIGCHLVGTEERHDVHGKGCFDQLVIGKLPLVALSTTESPFFTPGDPIKIQTNIQGTDDGSVYVLTKKLVDHEDRLIAQKEFPLKNRAKGERADPVVWDLPPVSPGIYQIMVRVDRGGKGFNYHASRFVVMESTIPIPKGEFGWSIHDSNHRLSRTQLIEAAARCGVNWVKYPVWSTIDLEREDLASEITKMIERAERNHIQIVGVLNDPPAKLLKNFEKKTGLAELFTLPAPEWSASIDPVVARYAYHIRHWQLGDDKDPSFAAIENVSTALEAARTKLYLVGRDSEIGIPWNVRERPLPLDLSPNSWLQIRCNPNCNFEEFQEYLKQSAGESTRWLTLEPDSKGDLKQRASDLSIRMIHARKVGIEGIFIDPLDPDSQILSTEGAPQDLYLPYSSMVRALRGQKYVGSMSLLNDSHNAVFSNDSETVVFMWNEKPVEEWVELGASARAFDLWNRPIPLAKAPETGNTVIPVGPVPVIVRHCSSGLVHWQLSLRFEQGKVSSEYGGHPDAILAENQFSQGITGTIRARLPADWKFEPERWSLTASVGEKIRLPTIVNIPSNTNLGRFMMRFDCEISAERLYRFSIFRPYEVGLGDVVLTVRDRVLPDGGIEIEQRIINKTNPEEILQFDCSLTVPGLKRQRRSVVNLKQGSDSKVYEIPPMKDLVGREVWLRAEQVNGRRILNLKWKLGELGEESPE